MLTEGGITLSALDHLLAAHCAPALAGIKPASLVSCQRSQFPKLPQLLNVYGRAFAKKDVCFRILHTCPQRYLLLVYRRSMLEHYLAQTDVLALLERFGYRTEEPLEAKLERLGRRTAGQKGFPHEIGLFLGYPVEDVEGFIRYGGAGCKLCGCWKVYGDVEHASRQFARIAQVCRACVRRVEQGETLFDVFAVA